MNLKEVCRQLTSTTLSLLTRKPGRYFTADYRIEHLGYSCLLLIGSSCEMLSKKELFTIKDSQLVVSEVFFIIMTIKHQLIMANEVEQAIDKNSFVCSKLLIRTNALISLMLDKQGLIDQCEIHNYLINFRNELPKLSELFGGSGLLPVEF